MRHHRFLLACFGAIALAPNIAVARKPKPPAPRPIDKYISEVEASSRSPDRFTIHLADSLIWQETRGHCK